MQFGRCERLECGIIACVMTIHRFSRTLLPFALAGLLLAGGCKKQNQQASSENPAPAAAPAPADQSATAPATTPATAPAPAPSTAPAPAPEAAAAPAPAAAPAAAPAPPPPPPPVVIPAGSHISVSLRQDLGSKISQPGQSFTATVAAPVRVGGVTVIRAGSTATGTVVDAKARGHFKGGALLSLRLDTVRADGGTYQVASSTVERVEKGKGKRTAGFVGGGAGLGAILGGVAGGGKGALIGGLVGAGAGTAGAGLTGNKDILIPAETTLTFRLERPVHISQ
jgi:hypothetical protein